jgi:RimJ/RimL family protein N-acetyltransferase
MPLGGGVEAQRFALPHVSGIVRTLATNLDHLKPWMVWASPENATVEAQIERLKICDRGWDHGGDSVWDSEAGFDYTLVDTATDEVVGACGLMTRQGRPDLEIGCWVARQALGRGIAKSLAKALQAQAWRFADVDSVVWLCDDLNEASAAVALKSGFEFVGVLDEPPPNVAVSSDRVQLWRVERPKSGEISSQN